MTAPFWMICRSPRHAGAKTEPKQRFATEADARLAAQQMADTHQAPFCVLAVTATIWPQGDQQTLL
jgi:hypothetical protein